MSGICGIYSFDNPALAGRDALHTVLDAIAHRGRAARRTFVDAESRLAIGHVFAPAFQAPGENEVPNWHEDAQYVATLDGAVFNAADFSSTACVDDPECGAVAEHLRQDASTFPQRLNGHFALAAWDKTHRELWLARDALGGKPLYFCRLPSQGLVVFASELKGILAHPAIVRRVNPDALTAYLTLGYVPAPLSIFENIEKVFPGEVVRFDAGGQVVRRQFWTVPPFNPGTGDLSAFASALREEILQSVTRHVQGARRAGVFLSGGTDSTILLGALKLLGIDDCPTFTLGFKTDLDQPHLYEDLTYAAHAVKRFGARHHEILIEPDHDPGPLLPTVFRQFDEPMLTPNAYSKCLLSEAAHRVGVNSCLSGSNAGPSFERAPIKKLKKLYERVGPSASTEEYILAECTKLFSFEEQRELVQSPVAGDREKMLGVIARYRDGVDADLSDTIKSVILRMQDAEKSVTVQDRTSALHGVEVRYPFYDVHVIRFANTIPAAMKGSESKDMVKAVLKAAFKDLLPEEIFKRGASGYPSYYWSKGEVEALRQQLLSPSAVERTGLMRPEAVARVLAEDAADAGRAIGKRTWALLTLQAWYEVHVLGNETIGAAAALSRV